MIAKLKRDFFIVQSDLFQQYESCARLCQNATVRPILVKVYCVKCTQMHIVTSAGNACSIQFRGPSIIMACIRGCKSGERVRILIGIRACASCELGRCTSLVSPPGYDREKKA